MKLKTIQKIITDKMKKWWDTIEDPAVKKLAEDNTIVTGGCITSMLLKEKVNDFDVYLKTQEAVIALATYYVKRFKVKQKAGVNVSIDVRVDKDTGRVQIYVKSAGVASEQGTEKPYEYFEGAAEGTTRAADYVSDIMDAPGEIEDTKDALKEGAAENEDPKYKPVFLSTNAISLSSRVQIVLRFYGEPEEIHKNYDFIHCTNYWANGKLVTNKEALESILTKEMKYVGSLYPVCSIFRLRKFIGRGWSINAGQILKILMQVSALDLTDINVLRDQLTGVDVAYFAQLLEKLNEKDPDKVDTAYLVEIIDRMF